MIEENTGGFERFAAPKSAGASRGVAWPRVTITRTGKFGFNKAAQEMLGNAGYVEYFYDWQGNRIGFVPVDAESPGAYKMHTYGPGISTTQTFGRSFLRHYNIPFGGKKSRAHAALVENGMIVIHLNDPMLNYAY